MDDVVWTEEALDDLGAIGVFHERTSLAYAQVTVQRLYDAVAVLQQYPRFGRKVPEIDHDAVRELIVEGYRIVYQLIRGRIEIVVVLHSRQDVRRKFRERSGEA